MAFEEDIGPALAKACELNSDSDAIHLARVAKIARNQLFGKLNLFGFLAGYQKESVPPYC